VMSRRACEARMTIPEMIWVFPRCRSVRDQWDDFARIDNGKMSRHGTLGMLGMMNAIGQEPHASVVQQG